MNAIVAAERTSPWILDAHDRCDRCGSQAYVAVTLREGDLFFCGHHFHQFEQRLSPVALSVIDERAQLTVRL